MLSGFVLLYPYGWALKVRSPKEEVKYLWTCRRHQAIITGRKKVCSHSNKQLEMNKNVHRMPGVDLLASGLPEHFLPWLSHSIDHNCNLLWTHHHTNSKVAGLYKGLQKHKDDVLERPKVNATDWVDVNFERKAGSHLRTLKLTVEKGKSHWQACPSQVLPSSVQSSWLKAWIQI